MIQSPLGSLVARLSRRMVLAIGRGQTQIVDDTGVVQKHQIASGPFETQDNVKRLAEFGFTSNPPAGSDATVVYIGGDRGNATIIATNHQLTRLKNLNPGEAALYDALGRHIWLTRDNGIVIEANHDKVTINNASEVTVNSAGDITVNAPNLRCSGEVWANGIPLSVHKHTGITRGNAKSDTPVAS